MPKLSKLKSLIFAKIFPINSEEIKASFTGNRFPDRLCPSGIPWTLEVVIVNEECRADGFGQPRGRLHASSAAVLEEEGFKPISLKNVMDNISLNVAG